MYGELVKLDEASHESLVRSKYDSLFEGGHVLVGPLALVNHACWSNLTFSISKRRLVQLKALRPVTLRKGAELLVNYGMEEDLGFVCQCCHPPSSSVQEIQKWMAGQ